MKRILFSLLLVWAAVGPVGAQRVLSLDSCRAMALQGNKQLASTRLSRDLASDVRKAARTKYLPKVEALGGYSYMSREVKLLSNDQKSALGNMGTNAVTSLTTSSFGPQLASILTSLGLDPAAVLPAAAASLNQTGQGIVDAFRTDTRSMWAGTVLVRQPLYMGGAIRAANRMADISSDMADTRIEQQTQDVLYDIEKAYWLVVSLKQKQRLAQSFRELVVKLNDDVQKMIAEGVATRADGLKVDVRVNEAEMQITQVENGLSLSRMLLCQLCGMPLDENFVLADEEENSEGQRATMENGEWRMNNGALGPQGRSQSEAGQELAMGGEDAGARPELRLLESAVELSRQAEKLALAPYLPHVGVVGGYTFSNPNVFNGFEKKVGGVWNVGVMVHVPVWNWMEGKFRVRAARTATQMARQTLDEAREKMDLQVAQSRFKVAEAMKRVARATKDIESARENLRCADAGFHEGVMDATTVMQAQTAWQQAETQRIDADIELRMAHTALRKVLGTLR